MPDRRHVVLTGAAGLIGGVVQARLASRYDLVPMDRVALPGGGGRIVDLDDLAGLRTAFEGASAIVHLGAASSVDAGWPEVLESNVVGTYHVFEAARAAGVERVVYASSNHVVGLFELDGAPGIYERSSAARIDHLVPLRPDSLYGVSKAFGEILGRFYAERHGLRVICLRLGTVLSSDDPTQPPPPTAPAWAIPAWGDRMRATWLSHRDCADLIARALEADVDYEIVYGVSDVPGRFWDLDHARRVLGFVPGDRFPSG